MVEKEGKQQQAPEPLQSGKAEEWRLDQETHGELIKRFGELDASTQRVTRGVLFSSGGERAAKFLALHERLNRIFERSLEVEPEKGYLTHDLVDVLFCTMRELDDGLTEGEDAAVRERILGFILKDKDYLPRVIDRSIKSMAGSIGERRHPVGKDYSLRKEQQ